MRLAGQWTRFGHDPATVETVGLLRLAAQVVTAPPDAVLGEHLLSRGQFDVLAALYRAGGNLGLTQAELAASMLITPAGMKKRIDALVAEDWIERLQDPSDSRKQRLHLTPAGLQRLADLLEVFFEAEARALSPLGSRDQATLRRLLARLISGPERPTAKRHD